MPNKTKRGQSKKMAMKSILKNNYHMKTCKAARNRSVYGRMFFGGKRTRHCL